MQRTITTPQERLSTLGLSQAWEIYQADSDGTFQVNTVQDIVGRLVQYGNLSEKQQEFLRNLLHQINNREQIAAQRKAEWDSAADCPTGKTIIKGEVLSTRTQESQYGTQYKMLVKDERGFKVFGSIPSCLQLFDAIEREYLDACDLAECKKYGTEVFTDSEGKHYIETPIQRVLERGDKVEFSATVTPSNDDVKFGFYKRPTKAKLVG